MSKGKTYKIGGKKFTITEKDLNIIKEQNTTS